MKVDPYRAPVTADAPTGKPGTVGAAGPDTIRDGRAVPSGGDFTVLSSQVRLANQAKAAAESSSPVRPEAVARAKALIASGTLGQDLGGLADKMIDSLLDQ
jgi:flagellar biosynthesis anti-sigma factor FlgM